MATNWKAISLPPNVTSGSFSADTMLLLTDGTVLVHNAYQAEWLRFTPDPKNGYAGGSWTLPGGGNSESDMANSRQFFATGVLNDGRVFAIGGEYLNGSNSPVNSPLGEIYDPVSNSWTQISALDKPASVSFVDGDAASCILADGRVLFGGATGGSQTAIWSPATSSWVVAGTAFGTQANTKVGSCDEESWTLLPDGSVLTVNVNINGQQSPTSAERYIPSKDIWEFTTGSLPNTLPLTTLQDNTTNPPNTVQVFEIGPSILLPTGGKVIAFGGTGLTAIYDPSTDTWTAGPNFPADPGDPSNNNIVLAPSGFLTLSDSPAVLQPNGRVLATAGTLYLSVTKNSQGVITGRDYFSKNLKVCQYDPVANTITKLADQPPSGVTSQDSWTSRFLLLPTGQILLSTQQGQVYIYTPPAAEGTYQAAWQPVISSFPNTLIIGQSYLLTGTGLNGLSHANSYGDDAQMPTNYPIVQLTDTTSNAVYYLKTQDFSSRGVAVPGPVTASVTVVRGTPPGAYNLVTIANGIPSAPQLVEVGTEDIGILLQENEFGGGQVAAQINQAGAPAVYQAVLFVAIEGYTLADLGITDAASLLSPGNKPKVNSPLSKMTFSYSGAAEPEDITYGGPQRVLFPFQVSFADDSMFSDATLFPAEVKQASVTITATFQPPTGAELAAVAIIKLLQTPNPFILHNDPNSTDPTVKQAWYLSMDLRVFQITAGTPRFGLAPGNTGNPVTDATHYITQVIKNLNGDRAAADGLFQQIAENEDSASLSLAPNNGANPPLPVYNFALARVRTQDIAAAADVRVFFRMWAAQQTNAVFDPNTTYASRTTGSNRVPVLGVQNQEIITIPFFASPRVTVGGATTMATQTDAPNVQASIAADPLGAEVHTYFGCWLDINQPTTLQFPAFVQGDAAGPFTNDGPLLSIQSFARSTHQCLIAEISYTPDPIPSGADPSNTDKLAQRNLTFVNVPNPGHPLSRRVPQTLEIRPSPSALLPDGKPDELVIHWGNLPRGSVASLYLPGVDASTILGWAARLYTTHRLTAADAHTIQMPVGDVSYVPIPQGSVVNYAGLLTLDLPGTVKKGQKFEVVVRQITSAGGIAGRVSENETVGFSEKGSTIAWRRVLGQFNLTIPVSTKKELLAGEETQLSIMRWIGKTIPVASRWYLVFQRYLEQLAGRVTFMGGDPTQIPATGTGIWKGPIIIHPHPEADLCVPGKVETLVYDTFGDFESFTVKSIHGKIDRFESHERGIEQLARRAWQERSLILVRATVDRPHCPMSITFLV